MAALPGIVEASYAVPDIHWGYGFPIGGVAATDIAAEQGHGTGGIWPGASTPARSATPWRGSLDSLRDLSTTCSRKWLLS